MYSEISQGFLMGYVADVKQIEQNASDLSSLVAGVVRWDE